MQYNNPSFPDPVWSLLGYMDCSKVICINRYCYRNTVLNFIVVLSVGLFLSCLAL